jgi:ABC-type transport system involved in multi-copper enzyme maturation permease subunit
MTVGVGAAAPGLARSVRRVFELSLPQMLWSRRSLFLGFLLGAPLFIAAALRATAELVGARSLLDAAPTGGATVFATIVGLLYVRFIVPVLGMFYGTSLIADEVEERTITYLFTRPIPRRAVLFGKYLAYLVCTVLLVLPSVLLVYFVVVPTGGSTIGGSFLSLMADLAALMAGLAAYGALFALVGARLKRPLVAGLVFAFGWEPGVLLFPGFLKRLTVAYYLQALVGHEMPQESTVMVLLPMFREAPSVADSLSALALIAGLALWTAGRIVETREYVLEP